MRGKELIMLFVNGRIDYWDIVVVYIYINMLAKIVCNAGVTFVAEMRLACVCTSENTQMILAAVFHSL